MGHIRLATLGHGKGRQQLGPEHVPKGLYAGSPQSQAGSGAHIFAAYCQRQVLGSLLVPSPHLAWSANAGVPADSMGWHAHRYRA